MASLWGCGGSTSKGQAKASCDALAEQVPQVRELGDSLTIARQQVFLEKLMAAAEREGWAGAVRYCHQAAETLTFVRGGYFSLQRLAARHRNPKNRLRDSLDQAAFSHFLSTHSKEPLVWRVSEGWRYYRPIYIMMPTCLKCHGELAELDGPALAEIRRRYPGDKATGFRMGDLRGLWVLEAHIP